MKLTEKTGQTGVLVVKVEEEDINSIFMNTDINEKGQLEYAYDNFANVFSENILEYAFAYANIPRSEITKAHREAAKSLIKLHEIDKLKNYFENSIPEENWDKAFLKWYQRKGVFGEVILHMILKEFKDTVPLISKMYFKDSFSQEAKGFDAVHVSADGSTLWLGETKFYKTWQKKGIIDGGVDELVKDLKQHFTKDYLSNQFVIIKRGLDTQYEHPHRDMWVKKLNESIRLKDVFQFIRIPLLCIYEDKIAQTYLQAIDDAVKESHILKHTITIRDYYKSINDVPYNQHMQTILILMPIEAKNKLIGCMLEKIWHMQSI